MRLSREIVSLLLIAASPIGVAETVTINFDTAPNGTAISNGTILNSVYASQGILFERNGSAFQCADGFIYANSDRPADFAISSPPNVVSQCPPPLPSDTTMNFHGQIRASFATSPTRVCIDVRPSAPTAAGFIRAYRQFPILLASSTSAPGITQAICVSASSINLVEFGGNPGFARFDNLSVTYGEPSSEPVPSLSLLSVVLLAFMVGVSGLSGFRSRFTTSRK